MINDPKDGSNYFTFLTIRARNPVKFNQSRDLLRKLKGMGKFKRTPVALVTYVLTFEKNL